MSNQIDHERCSELLAGYLKRELQSEEQDSVEAHLGECSRCSAEADALRALLALEGAELTSTESERLRLAVKAGIGEIRPAAESEVIAVPRSRRGRLLPALGAAALVAVAVIFVANLFSNVSFVGGGDEASEAGGAVQDAAVAEIHDHLRFRGAPRRLNEERSAIAFGRAAPPQKDAAAEEGAVTGSTGAGGDTDQAGAPAAKARSRPLPRPVFVRAPGRLTDRRLALVGRYGLPLVLFPDAYKAADVESIQEDFLQQLSNAAPEEAQREQILDCGLPILARPQPVLPALATFGEKDGDTVLVLAFAWAEDTSARLRRYMVWTWPLGDCDAVPDYRAGFIKG